MRLFTPSCSQSFAGRRRVLVHLSVDQLCARQVRCDRVWGTIHHCYGASPPKAYAPNAKTGYSYISPFQPIMPKQGPTGYDLRIRPKSGRQIH
jgi:hypothetical protein